MESPGRSHSFPEDGRVGVTKERMDSLLATATKEGLESSLPFQYCHLHSTIIERMVPSLLEVTVEEQLCVNPHLHQASPKTLSDHCFCSSDSSFTHSCLWGFLSCRFTPGAATASQITTEVTRGYLCVAEVRIIVWTGSGCRMAYFNDDSGV